MRAPNRRSLRRAAAAALALGALATTVAPAGAGVRDRIDDARRRAAFPVAVAYDFGFAGVPDDVSTGTYRFPFVNAGRQPHEIVFLKMAENREDDSREEVIQALDNFDLSLLDVPVGPEGPEPNGVAFAGPLDRDRGSVSFEEEGRYLYVCFIPDPATGLPHYKLDPGMLGFVDVQ